MRARGNPFGHLILRGGGGKHNYDSVSVAEASRKLEDAGLRKAEAGDLLLIFGDDTTRSWKQIINFDTGSEPVEAKTVQAAEVAELPDLGDYVIEPTDTLIRDEKGVRLAREEND